jgi:uncharacterized protein (DUF1330 family)
MSIKGSTITVENRVYGNSKQMRETLDTFGDKPVVMLNLLKFHKTAKLKDETMTGKEVYSMYSSALKDILKELGGHVIFAGDVKGLVVGRVSENWDECLVVYYPSMTSFVQMNQSDKWKEISKWREAGLAGQLLIPLSTSTVADKNSKL